MSRPSGNPSRLFWSEALQGLRDGCPRALFWTLAGTGADTDAVELPEPLDMGCLLTDLRIEIELAIPAQVRSVAAQIGRGEGPSAPEEIAKAIGRQVDPVRHRSREQASLDTPVLRSVWEGGDAHAECEAVQGLRHRFARHLLASRFWAEAADDPRNVVGFSSEIVFELPDQRGGSIECRVQPRFVALFAPAHPVIFTWETASIPTLDPALYAFALQMSRCHEADRFRVYVADLETGTERAVHLGPAELRQVETRIRSEALPLDQGLAASDFPYTHNLAHCRRCPFAGSCGGAQRLVQRTSTLSIAA